MKLFVSLLLISIFASAQSVHEQAAQLARPATESGFKNQGSVKMLEAIEHEEIGAVPPPTATPSLPPTPVGPRKTDLVSHARTTRFLFLKIADSLLRFHVDANLGDDELEVIVNALTSTCLKTQQDDSTCDSTKQNSMIVDRAFIADAKLSQTSQFSKQETPQGQIWKLTCASGEDECFDKSKKIRAFKMTTNKAASTQRILARGFESQSIKALAKKRRAPAFAQKTFDRVYITRTTSEKIRLLPKGTL